MPSSCLLCSQLLLTCFTLSLRLSASLTACGGEYVNGQRPITANGDYRLHYSHWTLTHQPFSDLDCRRLQVGYLPSGVGHVRSSCTTSTTSWRSVAGEYRKSASIPSRGEGSPIPWPGELGRGVWVPRVSGKRGARELERASSQSYSARNCDIHPVLCRFPVDQS